MAGDVFISHASEDASVTAQVCALLEGRGLRCWMAPRDVPGGAVWDEAILDAIEGSRVFLLILSGKANQSQFVKNEVNRAFSQNKPIVTFRLEEVAPGRSLELYLARHHWTDGFPPPLPPRVETLAGSLAVLLDGAAAAAASTPSTAKGAARAAPPRPTLAARLLSPLRAAAKEIRALSRQGQLLAFGVIALVAAITGVAVWNLKPLPTVSKPVTRLVITLPPGDRLAGPDQPVIALSPDGSHLAYVATGNETQQIYLRAMDSLDVRPLAGTNGATNPFFSPDGQWLGFFADGKLKKISVSGGPASTLADVPFSRGAAWGDQGMIVFPSGPAEALQEMSEAGGTPKPLTRLEAGENSHRWPEFLPGHTGVIFAAGTSAAIWTAANVAVQTIGTGERRNLIRAGTDARYVPSGHLVYAQGGTLMAVPFDSRRLEVTGTAVPVVADILQSEASGAAQYSFSATGSLVYVPGGIQLSGRRQLVWVSRNGTEEALRAPTRAYGNPRLSPDGRQVAVEFDEQEVRVWLYDLARESAMRLTFEGTLNRRPLWTPDGKRVIFESGTPGNLFWQPADGSGRAERLTSRDYDETAGSFSPDQQLLAFQETNPTTHQDIWILRLSDRKAQPFLQTAANESAPRFSPDGRWLAYVSDESGHREVYLQPYPGPGRKWQVSTDGGSEPVWNPNGRELFYRSGEKMLSAEIMTQPSFSVGKPRVLFEGDYISTAGTAPYYDVSRDGQRFLMLKAAESDEGATQIVVVQNFFEELKQKVPTGKN